MVKLTEIEREVLETLRLRPNGAILRQEEMARAALSLALRKPRLVSDIYELPSGHHIARITPAGRAALSNSEEPQP